MKINIPTKHQIERMVDMAIRKEMSRIDKILNRFRKRLVEFERKQIELYPKAKRSKSNLFPKRKRTNRS